MKTISENVYGFGKEELLLNLPAHGGIVEIKKVIYNDRLEESVIVFEGIENNTGEETLTFDKLTRSERYVLDKKISYLKEKETGDEQENNLTVTLMDGTKVQAKPGDIVLRVWNAGEWMNYRVFDANKYSNALRAMSKITKYDNADLIQLN